MKENKKEKKAAFLICYGIMIVAVILAVALSGLFSNHNKLNDTFDKVIDASTDWKYEDGSKAAIIAFNELETDKVAIYHEIPDDLPAGTSFCFSSRNVFTKVYVNDVLMESVEKEELPFFSRSPATLWHYIQIPESAYGGEIKIIVTNVYNKNCTSLNDILFCNPSYYVLSYIKSQLLVLTVCALMALAGIAFIIVDVYAYVRIKKELDVFYLGLFAFLVSIWSVFETRVVHFFITDGRVIQILEMYILLFIPVPMLFYLEKFFVMKKSKSIEIILGCIVATFIITMTLAFLKVADLQNTVVLIHFNLVLTIIQIFGSAIGKIRVIKKGITSDIILYLVGLVSIIITCSIDLFRFWFSTGSADAAQFIRIGLLIAISCYGTVGIKNIITKVDFGIKNEFISKLAYIDGLTGIGNRTAYQEKINEYQNKKNTVLGIVMFDVNSLKYINDVYGHKSGDELIVKSAETIKNAFLGIGSCYRIGGDEFAVFIDGINEDDISIKYNKSIKTFTEILEHINTNRDSDKIISIAYGMALYNSANDSDISGICELADKRMYKCKAQIKAKMVSQKRLAL